MIWDDESSRIFQRLQTLHYATAGFSCAGVPPATGGGGGTPRPPMATCLSIIIPGSYVNWQNRRSIRFPEASFGHKIMKPPANLLYNIRVSIYNIESRPMYSNGSIGQLLNLREKKVSISFHVHVHIEKMYTNVKVNTSDGQKAKLTKTLTAGL